MKIIVFSDLDATLLDPETYLWKPAERAIDALRKRGAALVMVTSKTLAEVKSLHEELRFEDPFVFENGGGIAFRNDRLLRDMIPSWERKPEPFRSEGFTVLALGTRYETLLKSLADISTEVCTPLVGFSGMSEEEVRRATWLSLEQARKARMRFFDEPFVIQEEWKALEAEIHHAALRRGLNVVKGGRFWHLIGHAGKGKAVSILLEGFRNRYRELVSIGLGDSANDIPFLQLVDLPVFLGKPEKAETVTALPENTRRYDVPGPQGWNQAVLDILDSL